MIRVASASEREGTWRVLHLAAVMAEATAEFSSLQDIPELLVMNFPVERASLSVVRQAGSLDRVIVSAQHGREQLADTPTVLESVEICRQVDALHQMRVVLHARPGAFAGEWQELLTGAMEGIVRGLALLLAWRERPELLGEEFSRITDSQWRVLCLLETDMSEKQMAGELQISPHTLHCYVKAIYRRLSVRSRIGAVQVLHRAARRYRARVHDWERGEILHARRKAGLVAHCITTDNVPVKTVEPECQIWVAPHYSVALEK